MKATWDIETARTCKIDTIAPEKCEQCRDNKYCFKQMTLFDLLEEYDHGWKKVTRSEIPDNYEGSKNSSQNVG